MPYIEGPEVDVPKYMLLTPHFGHLVIYCRAGLMRIYDKESWLESGDKALPLAALSDSDFGALMWFMQHWVKPEKLHSAYKQADVTAVLDW